MGTLLEDLRYSMRQLRKSPGLTLTALVSLVLIRQARGLCTLYAQHESRNADCGQIPPLALLHAVQEQLARVNPEQQIYSIVRDLETWVRDAPEWQQEHLAAWIFGILGSDSLGLRWDRIA